MFIVQWVIWLLCCLQMFLEKYAYLSHSVHCMPYLEFVMIILRKKTNCECKVIPNLA